MAIAKGITVAKSSRERFTTREREIIALVAEGLSDKEIGRRLALSGGTVRGHLHKIYQRTGAANRTALAAMVHRDRLVSQQKMDIRENAPPARRLFRFLLILGQGEAICTQECFTEFMGYLMVAPAWSVA
jgi:DNA-binding CsgD family transcriptional regulator